MCLLQSLTHELGAFVKGILFSLWGGGPGPGVQFHKCLCAREAAGPWWCSEHERAS